MARHSFIRRCAATAACAILAASVRAILARESSEKTRGIRLQWRRDTSLFASFSSASLSIPLCCRRVLAHRFLALAMFVLDNIQHGDEVHQRCVLISGRCSAALAEHDDDGFVEIETKNDAGKTTFPEQRWPMCRGWFKALVILAPGPNKIIFRSGHDATHTHQVRGWRKSSGRPAILTITRFASSTSRCCRRLRCTWLFSSPRTPHC